MGWWQRLLSGATCACVFVSKNLALGANETSKTEVAIVHTEQTMQVLRGFGASGGWWAQEVGNWPADTRRDILKLLFDRSSGIGLTLYRHNLGAGSANDATITDKLRRTESFLKPDEGYDWSKDAAAMRILKEACAIGAEEVTLFALSPPVSLTRNGHAYGDKDSTRGPESNLKPGCEHAFARYLCAVASHLINDEHLPIEALSPLNEPEWGWDTPEQEGCHYSPSQATELLAATLAEARASGLNLRIEGPENGSWKTAAVYQREITQNPELRMGIPVISLHSYFSTLPDRRTERLFLDREWPEVRVRMTEWCELKSGLDPTMQSALVLAKTVIEDLVVGRAESWEFWLAASPHDYRDGLIHLDPSSHSFSATRRLWVLGQFSRFLRPGFRLLKVECSTSAPRVLAAESPDIRSIVVIVINSGAIPELLRLNFTDGAIRRIDKAVTTDSSRAMAEFERPSDVRAIPLPALSVSTIVFSRSEVGCQASGKSPLQ